MSTRLQEELIKSANLIREKYRALKRGKFIDEEMRLENLKPLTEPLEKLVKQEKHETMPVIVPRVMTPHTPSRIPSIQFRTTPPTLEFGRLASKYLSNYLQPNDKKITDTTYGLRKEQDDGTSSTFSIGSSKAEISNDDISVEGKTFKGTEGLWQLLTLKVPDESIITDEDMDNYREILLKTNAHKKGFKPDAQISANSGRKYKNVIAPMFASSEPKVGSGLNTKEVTNNAIDYVYWNDPNELVDRLRLLILSREAGNSGVGNEIESIIEELRESNIIY